MKRFWIFIVSLCMLVGAFAQEGKEIQLYKQAEDAYKIGHFEEAIKLLSDNLDAFSARTRETSLKLLALCYLEEDKIPEAEQYVSMLLKYNPYYTVSFSDPLRFVDMIERLKKGQVTITTASQQAETLDEAPVPVTLITEEMIEVCGFRNLKEVLVAYVPGMTAVESNEEMNIAMRGVYSSGQEKILIMLNGHRLNSYSTNTSSPDFSISLEKVKQIEVLRGPSSSLYGGVALTAVVNIITKSGADIDGAEIGGGIGNHGQLKGHFLLGRQYMDWNIMTWMSVYNATGEKVNIPVDEQKGTLPVPGQIIIGGFNKKPSFDVGLNLGWKNFHFLYNTSFSKTVAPYSMSYFFAPYSYDRYMTFNGNSPGYAKLSHHIEASIDKKWNQFNLRTGLTFDAENQTRYQISGDTVPDVGYNILYPNGTTDSVYLSKGCFQIHNWLENTCGLFMRGNYSYKLDNNNGNLNVGVQWNRFTLRDSYYAEGDHFNRVIVTYDDKKNLYVGNENYMDAYVQLKHQWKDLLILNAGFRYDYKKRRNGKVLHEYSPRLALILLQPKWNLKFSYAKSFVDAPYFYRNNTLDTTMGGENLLPEYSHSFQLTFAANRLLTGLELESNLFYTRTIDIIIPDGLVYTNAGILNNMGVEFSASYKYKRFSSWFNFTWQHVLSAEKYGVYDNLVYNVPAFKTNWICSFEAFRGLTLNSYFNFLSGQKSLFTKPDAEGNMISEVLDIPARVSWNGSIEYKWSKWKFGIQLYNLTNKIYEQGGSSIAPIPQQGLWYMFNFSYYLK